MVSCINTPHNVAVVSDSMGYYDQSIIKSEITGSSSFTISHYSSTPGTTTWTNQNLVNQIKSPNNDVVVVTFGLNETRYIRGDADALPHKTLTQVLTDWKRINDMAKTYKKCLVWTTTQTEWPLNTQPTLGIISSLNKWIRANAKPAEWQPTVDYNVKYQGASWVKPEDGFHLRAGSWGPHAFGKKIQEAIANLC